LPAPRKHWGLSNAKRATHLRTCTRIGWS